MTKVRRIILAFFVVLVSGVMISCSGNKEHTTITETPTVVPSESGAPTTIPTTAGPTTTVAPTATPTTTSTTVAPTAPTTSGGTTTTTVPTTTDVTRYTLTIEYHVGEDVYYQVEQSPALATLKVPTLGDYEFLKWTAADGSDFTNTNLRSITLTKNETIVLTAVFNEPIEYFTVSFETNNGSTIENVNVAKGGVIEKPLALTKDGYTFAGWYKSLDDTNAYDFDSKVLSSFTLYAKWVEKRGTHFDSNLKKDGPLTQEALPSLGSPKILVIPVNLDPSKKTTAIYNDIKTAFSGTKEETGWESVRSYYQESSYGKLNFEVEVSDWFTPSKTASYYDSYYDEETYEYGSNVILHEALKYFDGKYDYSDYDYDGDGFIDTVWLVYNCDVDYESDESLYWAFTAWDYRETEYDGVAANYYAFAGTDFMYEETELYDYTDIKVDAHTYIHETGHLLGLDDYYDYDESCGFSGSCYGADMMDYNIGDHGPINKILLGWVDPIVVTSTTTIDLKSFAKVGEVLLVTNNKNINSIYEEYFLIEFYDGSGLNEHDEQILTVNGQAIGIRVWHVDATQNIVNGEVELTDGKLYQSGFKYNNSNTKYGFVEILRADNNPSGTYDSAILYTPTSNKFGSDVYSSYKLNGGKALFFTMTVNSIGTESANVTITFKSTSGSGSANLPWI